MFRDEIIYFKNDTFKWISVSLMGLAALLCAIDFICSIGGYSAIAVIANLLSIASFVLMTIAAAKAAESAERHLIAVAFLITAAIAAYGFVNVITSVSNALDYANKYWSSYYSENKYDLGWILSESPVYIVLAIRYLAVTVCFAAAGIMALARQNGKYVWFIALIGFGVMIGYWVFLIIYNAGISLYTAGSLLLDIGAAVMCINSMNGEGSASHTPSFSRQNYPGFNSEAGYTPNVGFIQNAPGSIVFCKRCGAKYDTGKGEFCPVCGLSFRQKL